MATASLESHAELAERALRAYAERTAATLRASYAPLDDEARAALPGYPSAATLRRAAEAAWGRAASAGAEGHYEASLAVLLSEGYARALRAPSGEALEALWTQAPLRLARGEEGAAHPAALGHLWALERERDKRAAWHAAWLARVEEREVLRAAQASVEAWRDAADALAAAKAGAGPFEAWQRGLGLGAPGAVRAAATALLRETEEVFRELDGWARGRLGLPREGELATCERARSVACERATTALPPGDRVGAASRWVERVGLGGALGRVRDEAASASRRRARGVRAVVPRAGERVVVVGEPFAGARGAVQYAGAVGEALSFALPGPSELWGARWGRDRVHARVARRAGEALYESGGFLTREAGVDRGAREAVWLELLHAGLVALREAAADALLLEGALARSEGFVERARDGYLRAVASRPSPREVLVRCADEALSEAGAVVLGAALEQQLFERWRGRYDEDWFRNPRAGEGVRADLDALRKLGAEALLRDDLAGRLVTSAAPEASADGAREAAGVEALVGALAARFGEAFRSARA